MLVYRIEAMIKRDCWGHSHCATESKILGPAQDRSEQKHLSRMFSLIENEGQSLNIIRYRGSSNHKWWQLWSSIILTTLLEASGKPKSLGLRSIIEKLKWKELTEGHNQKWSLQLNLTQPRKLHHCINRLNGKTTAATYDQSITCQNAFEKMEHWIFKNFQQTENKTHALSIIQGTWKQTKTRNCLIHKNKSRNTFVPSLGTTYKCALALSGNCRTYR